MVEVQGVDVFFFRLYGVKLLSCLEDRRVDEQLLPFGCVVLARCIFCVISAVLASRSHKPESSDSHQVPVAAKWSSQPRSHQTMPRLRPKTGSIFHHLTWTSTLHKSYTIAGLNMQM